MRSRDTTNIIKPTKLSINRTKYFYFNIKPEEPLKSSKKIFSKYLISIWWPSPFKNKASFAISRVDFCLSESEIFICEQLRFPENKNNNN
jgi:hypothetical protein